MKKKIFLTLGVIATLILAFFGVLWFNFTRSSRYGDYLEREYEREMWNWSLGLNTRRDLFISLMASTPASVGR